MPPHFIHSFFTTHTIGAYFVAPAVSPIRRVVVVVERRAEHPKLRRKSDAKMRHFSSKYSRTPRMHLSRARAIALRWNSMLNIYRKIYIENFHTLTHTKSRNSRLYKKKLNFPNNTVRYTTENLHVLLRASRTLNLYLRLASPSFVKPTRYASPLALRPNRTSQATRSPLASHRIFLCSSSSDSTKINHVSGGHTSHLFFGPKSTKRASHHSVQVGALWVYI